MNKKRVAALLTAAVLLLCGSAQAIGNNLFTNLKYGTLTPYENRVYGYSLNVYSRFGVLSDENVAAFLEESDREAAENGEDSEYIYDLRVWSSPDKKYIFEVQVKEPTCESFEQEIEAAPHYMEKIQDQFTPEQQLNQLHDGILRDTPVGQMLEIAYSYTYFYESGTAEPNLAVYYDYYGEDYEYIFLVHAINGDYESAQKLLDTMVQTVSIWETEQ